MFRKGEKVFILNSTLNGRIILEGRAVVVKPVYDVDNQYLVDFGDGYGPIERFIDPLAQLGDTADVAEYIARLNAPASDSAGEDGECHYE